MWDNFSSDTYKALPAVGKVQFYNPYSAAKPDEWGNNDAYSPPGGGPGYYRPASLVSVWATAPYLHNNALGVYTHDPSVQGRLAAFDDGIDKLFSKHLRPAVRERVEGDMRASADLGLRDEGFIYRTTTTSYLGFPRKFVPALISGITGPTLFMTLSVYLWVALLALWGILLILAPPRYAGVVLLLLGTSAAGLIRFIGLDEIYPWLWLVPLLAILAGLWLWTGEQARLRGQVVFAALFLATGLAGWRTHQFLSGNGADLHFGPIPAGVPVNLLMNINPEAPMSTLLRAGSTLTHAVLHIRRDHLVGDGVDAQSARKNAPRALKIFEDEAGQALLEASKCPDFVLDRGHWFAEDLSPTDKEALKAFLRTL